MFSYLTQTIILLLCIVAMPALIVWLSNRPLSMKEKREVLKIIPVCTTKFYYPQDRAAHNAARDNYYAALENLK